MNTALEKTLFFLTQKSNLTEISVDELSYLVNKHPYFAPAQMALAVKLQQDNSFESQQQLQKTALYFSNPDWLQYQLSNGEVKKFTLSESFPQQSAPVTATVPSVIQEEPVAINPPVSDEYKAFIPAAAPAIRIPTVEEVKEIMHSIDEKHEEETSFIPPSLKELVDTPEIQEHQAKPIDISIPSYSKTFEKPLQEPVTYLDTANNNSLTTEEQQAVKFSSVLANQLADFKKPVEENTKLDFEMEPYYTIDYFASQGIKADLTQLPHDKLTKQLLTFTDWLKKMKQASPNPQDLGTDPELESAIQNIAQSSNEVKEIATETMAEVFVKQGKIDKAVQLYIKLSFLDPEKSSYFAGKIQQLKGM